MAFKQIPCATEQGICKRVSGNFFEEQGRGGAAKPAEPSTPGGRSENVCVPSTPVAMQKVGFLANPSFTLRSPSAARQPRASLPATIASLPVHACAGACPAARLCPPAPTL